jgi:hypothetical protein
MRRPIYINRSGARRRGIRRGWASAEIVWYATGGRWFADHIHQGGKWVATNLSSTGWSWSGK